MTICGPEKITGALEAMINLSMNLIYSLGLKMELLHWW